MYLLFYRTWITLSSQKFRNSSLFKLIELLMTKDQNRWNILQERRVLVAKPCCSLPLFWLLPVLGLVLIELISYFENVVLVLACPGNVCAVFRKSCRVWWMIAWDFKINRSWRKWLSLNFRSLRMIFVNVLKVWY